MRIVIDTNVIVSGVLNPRGFPGRVIESALAARFVVLYDDRLLKEYREVLSRPVFPFDASDFEPILDYIEREAERVSCSPSRLVLPDETDLPFLEVAISGCADALVTGNQRHFKPRRGRHEIAVLSPAELILRLA